MAYGQDRSLTRFALVAIVMTAVFAVALTWLARVVVPPRALTLYTSQDITYAAGWSGVSNRKRGRVCGCSMTVRR